MVDTSEHVDVVVVGAGLAGLVAARDIQRGGRSVRLLEARKRVGGRVWREATARGHTIERGGQWVGPNQVRLLALAAELGVETFEHHHTGAPIYRIADFTAAAGELAALTAELDRLAATLPEGAPWRAERAVEWDCQTFHTWLAGRGCSSAVLAYLHVITTGLFTAEPDELSLLHVLAYIRSAGSMHDLVVTAQESRFVDGSYEIAVRLAEHLGADVVRLATPVRRLVQRDELVVAEADQVSVSARAAVVAVPIALADRIAYEPPLPTEIAQLHQRVAPGAVVKVHCVYERPFWRSRGLSGTAMTDSGYVCVVTDNSPPSGEHGVLTGFVEADRARAFSRLPDDERRHAVISSMVDLFGPDAAAPIEYVETDWSAEEWTRAATAPTCHPAPGHATATRCTSRSG